MPAGLFPRNSRWFDGVDDRINSTSPYPGDSAVTFATWLRPEVLTGVWQIAMFAGGLGGNRGLIIGIGPTNVWAGGLDGGSFVYSTIRPSLGQWSRVVMTRTSGANQSLLYVNGLLAGTAALSATFAPAGAALCALGRYSTLLPYRGNIWDARIYSRAWTPAEVAADFEGEPVDPTGLVRSWALNDQTPATTYESIAGTNDVVTGALISAQVPFRDRRISEVVPWAPYSDLTVPDHVDLRPQAASWGLAGWMRKPVSNPLGVPATLYLLPTKTGGGFVSMPTYQIVTTGDLHTYLSDGVFTRQITGVNVSSRAGWMHFGCTLDRASGIITQYLNGQWIGYQTVGALGSIESPNSLMMYANANTTAFNDLMWRKGTAFTLEEIEDYYYRSVVPTGLTSHWSCTEGAGTAIADVVGGHNGTLSAANWTSETRSH